MPMCSFSWFRDVMYSFPGGKDVNVSFLRGTGDANVQLFWGQGRC